MPSSFLQSKQWQEFQVKSGREARFFGNDLMARYPLPFRKSYLLLHSDSFKPEIIDNIKKEVLLEGVIFIRFNLLGLYNKEEKEILMKNELEEAPAGYYFSATVSPPLIARINLQNDSLEKMLKNMKPKMRYGINLAEKRGVRIVHGDFHSFWDLLNQTAKRQNIKIHSREHYQGLLDAFGDNAKIITAEFKGEAVSSNLVLYYGGAATYLHGGSSDKYRNLQASYLLQWHIIKEAKEASLKYYDLGGISQEDNHSWKGISRFKLGFGAEKAQLMGAYDLILKPVWYQGYKFARKIFIAGA